MSLDQETVSLAKAILRDTGNTEVKNLRENYLDEMFEDTTWLDDNDKQFEDAFNEDLDDSELTELASLVRDSSGPGVSTFVKWMTALVTDSDDEPDDGEDVEPEEEAQEPRYVDVSALDDYDGWWSGYDTVDKEWKYVQGTTTPDDATVGWLAEEAAFAAMRASVTPAVTAPTIADITEVEGYPGWWAGRDTTETDPASQWKYVQNTTRPTDQTTGWLDQDAAFAAMGTDDEFRLVEPTVTFV